MYRYLALGHMFNMFNSFNLWYFQYRTSIIICFFPKTKNRPFLMGNPLANFCKLIDNICSISDWYCWLILSSSSMISFSVKAFINTSLFTKWNSWCRCPLTKIGRVSICGYREVQLLHRWVLGFPFQRKYDPR